ncbi:ABC transporter permease, partial [Candidatus Bipolaricaulota bacterium]|nr:ABC transporter permease [Candidatus Bipolaricaulota bacterium]
MCPFKRKQRPPAEELGVSLWRLAWRRFRRHKVGRVGGVIVALLFLVLIFAEFVSP